MWVIVANMADVEGGMGLQEMLDTMPKGGKLMISEGTVEISESLKFPDGDLTIIGSHIKSGVKGPSKMTGGNLSYYGDHDVFWDGSGWKGDRTLALKFETRGRAEKAAFELVARRPHLIGSVRVGRSR